VPPRPAAGRGPTAAARADRHRLYEAAVQDPGDELRRLERLFREAGRAPGSLREDFCGTALLAARWVAGRRGRTATAVDLDAGVLAWARAHRLPALGAAARRLRLRQGDVRRAGPGRFDAVVALNYSYQVFHRREWLCDYFRAVRRSLAPDGLFLLDAFGGWEAHRPVRQGRRLRGGARYVWEQEPFDPITHRLRCHIHFEFPDGSRLARAFTYDWRLWSVAELSEALAESGFGEVRVLWDVAPAGRVRYAERRRAANQPAWIAYLAARPRPLSGRAGRP
jgi:SAM-dependent methyltransferase